MHGHVLDAQHTMASVQVHWSPYLWGVLGHQHIPSYTAVATCKWSVQSEIYTLGPYCILGLERVID